MIPWGRVVVVEWEDAWSNDNWQTEVPDCKEEVCQTFGVVITENDRGILLAQTMSSEAFGAIWFIPNGMIRSVTQLKKGPPA